MIEEVLGVMLATEYGRIPVFHCNLIFTSERIIVAKKGISKEVAGLVAGGAVGQWLAIRSDKKKAQELKQQDIEEILKADKKNYEIPYSETLKVEMKKLSRFSWPYSTEIKFTTDKKKRKFKLKNVKFEEAIELFRALLPDKVDVK
jgi:hypothetical protein